MTIHTEEDLATLNELLVELETCRETDDMALAKEHFTSARTYLLSAMPLEYEATLDLARESVSRLRKESTRLDELLGRLQH